MHLGQVQPNHHKFTWPIGPRTANSTYRWQNYYFSNVEGIFYSEIRGQLKRFGSHSIKHDPPTYPYKMQTQGPRKTKTSVVRGPLCFITPPVLHTLFSYILGIRHSNMQIRPKPSMLVASSLFLSLSKMKGISWNDSHPTFILLLKSSAKDDWRQTKNEEKVSLLFFLYSSIFGWYRNRTSFNRIRQTQFLL